MALNSVTGSHGSISFDEKTLFADLDHMIPLALRLVSAQAFVESAVDKGQFHMPLSQITNVQLKNVPFWGNMLEIGTGNRTLQLRFQSHSLPQFKEFVSSLNSAISSNLNGEDAPDLLSDDTKICPDCAESVKAAARKCRFCSYLFES